MSEPIQFEVHLTRDHIRKYRDITSKKGKSIILLCLLILSIIISDIKLTTSDILISVLLVILYCALYYQLNLSSKLLGPFKYTIDSSNIESIDDHDHIGHPWAVVEKIVRQDGIILVFYDPHLAHIIPESEVEDPGALYKQLQIWFDASRPSPSA